MKKIIALLIIAATLLSACASTTNNEIKNQHNMEDIAMNYRMPAEDYPHEGTWLIWPHKYTYGRKYQQKIEHIWVQLVKELHANEKVHIIAYDFTEQNKIKKLLAGATINMKQVDFLIAKSDDVWVRDTGPIFVLDENNTPLIADFGFDGWGKKAPYKNDNKIPEKVGRQKNFRTIDVSSLVLEGGSVETDGNGTVMVARSSLVSKNRNSKLSIKQVEAYLSKYLGIRNFIWTEGVTDEDITDAHIDGTARFLDSDTILTVRKSDFAKLYKNINMDDYTKLRNAKNADGKQYEIVELPLTKKIVKGTGCYGSYLNYYLANKVVIVPIYNDENDSVAIKIIEAQYPDREIVPIIVNDLFKYGGMIHCVTQQQPKLD